MGSWQKWRYPNRVGGSAGAPVIGVRTELFTYNNQPSAVVSVLTIIVSFYCIFLSDDYPGVLEVELQRLPTGDKSAPCIYLAY